MTETVSNGLLVLAHQRSPESSGTYKPIDLETVETVAAIVRAFEHRAKASV